MIYKDLLNDLFNPETKKNVMKMFVSEFQHNGFTDRMPLNSDNFTLRLHKPTNSYVNFEFLISSKSGRYFKPVAIFNSDGVINLFDELKETYKTQNFNTDSTVKYLTTENNKETDPKNWFSTTFLYPPNNNTCPKTPKNQNIQHIKNM